MKIIHVYSECSVKFTWHVVDSTVVKQVVFLPHSSRLHDLILTLILSLCSVQYSSHMFSLGTLLSLHLLVFIGLLATLNSYSYLYLYLFNHTQFHCRCLFAIKYSSACIDSRPWGQQALIATQYTSFLTTHSCKPSLITWQFSATPPPALDHDPATTIRTKALLLTNSGQYTQAWGVFC